jgi:hypothetical protein
MPLMRHPILIILIVTIVAFQTKAQTKDTFIVRTQFANQGEQEDYWAEKLFHEKYKKENYKRYTGDIKVIDKNHIRFGNKILQGYFSPELKSIFTQGIFYPQIITGDSVSLKKSNKEISAMTDGQRVFYKMNQNDTLVIGEFEELKFLSKSPTIRRFRYWVYRKWSANPQVYFIELTNTGADKSTDMETFIKGATLTFVKEGWIIM